MRQRIIQTRVVRDEWFLSLPIEEQRFFFQLLATDRAEMSGLFEYPDRDFLHDMPFLSPQRLQLLKQRFEADGKVFFKDGWVWIANFSKNNSFTSITQLVGIHKQLSELERNKPQTIKYFIEKGLVMPDITEYVEKRRRNHAKKQLRREKPYLMGDKLDQEVERVLGIADSGDMDWATFVESGKGVSEYPTSESIGYEQCVSVAREHNMRPYQLYWFFYKAVERLKSAGRSKTDYLSYLREIATKSVSKELKDDEKLLAIMLYAKNIGGQEITKNKAEEMLLMGEL